MFSAALKLSYELAFLSSSGKLFVSFGAMALKALSPEAESHVFGIIRLFPKADRRDCIGFSL